MKYNMSSVNVCIVCGLGDQLLRCSRCKSIYYCSKEHQKIDWKKHKVNCRTVDDGNNVIERLRNCGNSSNNHVNHIKKEIDETGIVPYESSLETEILSARTESLSVFREEKSSTEKTLRCAKSAMPIQGENRVLPRKSSVKDFPEISLRTKSDFQHYLHRENSDFVLEDVCRNVIRDMDAYGVCVTDNFLGPDRGKEVLTEVLNMYSSGVFKDGQLVSNRGRGDLKTIRGDQITWIDGREQCCTNIGYLISQVDAVIMRANKMLNNGKLGNYTINGRTKMCGGFRPT